MTTALKLTFASLSVATALLACTAATSTDDVDVDVEASQLETKACPKTGCLPPPPPPSGPACVMPVGGARSVTYPGMADLPLNPYASTSGGLKTGSSGVVGGTFVAVTGDLAATASPSTSSSPGTGVTARVTGGITTSGGLVLDPTPDQLEFRCEGTTPDGLSLFIAEEPRGSGTFRCLACVDKRNGTPHGFTAVSVYVCPPSFPVNRCVPWGTSCTCSKQ